MDTVWVGKVRRPFLGPAVWINAHTYRILGSLARLNLLQITLFYIQAELLFNRGLGS